MLQKDLLYEKSRFSCRLEHDQAIVPSSNDPVESLG